MTMYTSRLTISDCAKNRISTEFQLNRLYGADNFKCKSINKYF